MKNLVGYITRVCSRERWYLAIKTDLSDGKQNYMNQFVWQIAPSPRVGWFISYSFSPFNLVFSGKTCNRKALSKYIFRCCHSFSSSQAESLRSIHSILKMPSNVNLLEMELHLLLVKAQGKRSTADHSFPYSCFYMVAAEDPYEPVQKTENGTCNIGRCQQFVWNKVI